MSSWGRCREKSDRGLDDCSMAGHWKKRKVVYKPSEESEKFKWDQWWEWSVNDGICIIYLTPCVAAMLFLIRKH